MDNIKLKFKISKILNLDQEVVFEKAVLQLQKDEYRILERSNSIIAFDRYGGPLIQVRGLSASKLDEGIFEILQSKGFTVLNLTYYVSYKFFLLTSLIALIIAVFSDFFILILLPFLLIFFFAEIAQQKRNAKLFLSKLID
jgi:hypothetical protein